MCLFEDRLRAIALIGVISGLIFMTSTTQIVRLPLQVSTADSLRRNGLVLFLTTIIGLVGASPLLLQKPEQENSSNYKGSHTWLLAQTDSNENTDPGKRNNGTPSSTGSTASVDESGTPGNGPGERGTPPGSGTGASPVDQ